MLLALAFALLAAPPAQEPGQGVIRGVVQSEQSGRPVPLAAVEADDGRATVFAMAGRDGVYHLRVSSGRQTLRIRHIEHAPHEIEIVVPAQGEVVLDVVLEHRPVQLAPVAVLPPADPRADSVAVARPDLGIVVDHRSLEGSLPGLEMAGEGEAPDGEVLYLRGSAANLQLVLLDGAPVYAPFHRGGLMERFEPAVVRSARLYLGGAPARYDGGLSYIMDLATRSGRGDRHSLGGSVDLVSATARAEGPLGRVHYLASARTVHGASLGRLDGQPFPYRFADGLLRLDAPLPEGGVTLTAFANQEGVRVDTLGARDGFARWGNRAASVRYRGRFEGADVEGTLAYGRFDADVPIRNAMRLFMLRGSSDRARGTVDFIRHEGAVHLRYGASFERTWLTHQALQPEQDRNLVYVEVSGSTAGGYVDASWQPTPRVVLRGGVRADAFSVGGVAVLAPRASGTWVVSDGAALTVAGGRYHQYVRVPRPLALGTRPSNYADSARLATHLAVGGATHLVVNLDQQLGGGVRIGIEGFYKRFDGLPSPTAARDTVQLTDYTSGMDLWLRRSVGHLTGWFGYSLAWVWSAEAATGVGRQFAGRHTLNAGGSGVVWRGAELGARFAYGAGLAHTPGPFDERVLRSDLPNFSTGVVESDAPLRGSEGGTFLRLDVNLSRTFAPRLAGRTTRVTPYLRVINALDNRDGLVYRYFSEDGRQGVQTVGTLPVVPVFGLSWQF